VALTAFPTHGSIWHLLKDQREGLMVEHMRATRILQIARLLVAVTCLAAALSGIAVVPAARATLVYTTGGFPTTPPRASAPEWVWAARDDGSSRHRLVLGSSPLLSPNGKLVLYDSFSHGETRLAVMATVGGRARILIASKWQDAPTLAWSPDSRTIVAVIGKELAIKRLVSIDVTSGRILRTIATSYDFFGAQFSPGGTRLIYTRAPSVKMSTDIFIAGLHGGAPRRLTSDHQSFAAVWGPQWIVFSRSRKSPRANDAPKQDLYLVKPSGAALHRLTHLNPGYLLAGLEPMAFSASGTRLLAEFVGQDTSCAETVNPSTGAVRRVGTSSQGLIGYALSRDGSSILATTGGPDPNDSDVVAVPYHGGKPRVLARHARSPDWNARRGP
jgi:hypothetical protein